MNNKEWKLILIKTSQDRYCEDFRCPRISKKTKRCDGKCPKPHGKKNQRFAKKSARQISKDIDLEN